MSLTVGWRGFYFLETIGPHLPSLHPSLEFRLPFARHRLDPSGVFVVVQSSQSGSEAEILSAVKSIHGDLLEKTIDLHMCLISLQKTNLACMMGPVNATDLGANLMSILW